MVLALHKTRDPVDLETDLRTSIALHKWSAKIDRVHHLAIIVRHKPDQLFAEVCLDLLQRHIVVLAESINYDVDLSLWIIETLEHFQRTLGASNTRDVECQDQQNVVRKIKTGDSYRIECVRQIKNDVFVTLAQQIENL